MNDEVRGLKILMCGWNDAKEGEFDEFLQNLTTFLSLKT